jgi:hypothetical protein
MDFHQFDLKQLHSYKHPSIAIIGSAGRALCQQIVDEFNDIPTKVLVSPTESCDVTIPGAIIHRQLDGDLATNIALRQLIAMKEAKLDPTIDPRLLLVMDMTVSAGNRWDRDKDAFFCNSRCYGITMVLIMPQTILIPPTVRAQFDFVFLSHIDDASYKIYDMYGGMFETSSAFQNVIENHGCVVIDERKEGSVSEIIYFMEEN